MEDNINHPKHYQVGRLETVEVIEEYANAANGNISGRQLYHFCTAMKYLLRSPLKGRLLEDLQKCRWHISRWIDILEKKD